MEETWVQSNNKPDVITYEPLPYEMANVYLRKDIERVEQTSYQDGELQTQKIWRYKEKRVVTNLTKAEVEANFEQLYLTADVPAPTMTEIVNNLSDMVDDLSTRVDELENGGEV